MNRAQKAAWFTLIVLAIALGLSLAAFCVGYFVLGVPANRAAAGFGFMGIMGLLGLIPILFRKDKAKVQCDERDQMIHRTANRRRVRDLLGAVRRGGDDSVVCHRAGRDDHGQLPAVDGLRRNVRRHARAGIGHPSAVRAGQKRRPTMNRAQETSLALMILMPLGALITGSVAVLLVYTQGTHFIPLFMFTLAIVLGSLFWLLPPSCRRSTRARRSSPTSGMC